MAERGAPALLVTCEHGGNRVPRSHAALFAGRERLLASHQGFDAGALETARFIAKRFGAPLLSATTTRLLVDLNREESHRRVFSEVTKGLPRAAREALFERYHRPHRAQVQEQVAQLAKGGRRVVHVASHSFTPVLDGRVRRLDVGLLFDPARPLELALCEAWRGALRKLDPTLRVHRNRPYFGTSDGLTRWLRARFSAARYAGVELEVNQALLADARRMRGLRETLAAALEEALADQRTSAGRKRRPSARQRPSSRQT